MLKLSFSSFSQLSPIWDSSEITKIIKFLTDKHSLYLENETFEIEAGHDKEQIQIKISLKKVDASIIYPIEIICRYEDLPNLKKIEIAQIILDYIDLYWSDYFAEDRNIFVPLDWAHHECEGISFYLRGFVRNLSLEIQADNFLKEHGYGEHDISPISFES